MKKRKCKPQYIQTASDAVPLFCTILVLFALIGWKHCGCAPCRGCLGLQHRRESNPFKPVPVLVRHTIKHHHNSSGFVHILKKSSCGLKKGKNEKGKENICQVSFNGIVSLASMISSGQRDTLAHIFANDLLEFMQPFLWILDRLTKVYLMNI